MKTKEGGRSSIFLFVCPLRAAIACGWRTCHRLSGFFFKKKNFKLTRLMFGSPISPTLDLYIRFFIFVYGDLQIGLQKFLKCFSNIRLIASANGSSFEVHAHSLVINRQLRRPISMAFAPSFNRTMSFICHISFLFYVLQHI